MLRYLSAEWYSCSSTKAPAYKGRDRILQNIRCRLNPRGRASRDSNCRQGCRRKRAADVLPELGHWRWSRASSRLADSPNKTTHHWESLRSLKSSTHRRDISTAPGSYPLQDTPAVEQN